MTLRTLIVGLGQIGMGYDLELDPSKHVYSHARAFSVHPKFSLVGAVDTDSGRRRIFTQRYGLPGYADIDAALAKENADLVVVAVPTAVHGSIVRRILEIAKPRAILCEKPLSYDLTEARDMLRACEARAVKLYVNYPRRSDPASIEIKRRIDAGELGDPIKGVVWYSKGFLHNGSHFFNLLEYWLGSSTGSMLVERGRKLGDADSEPDLQVTFQRGVTMFLAAWEEAFSHYTVELLTQKGRLRYERGGKLIQWQPVRPDPFFPGYNVLSAEPETIRSGMDRYQWHVADQLARQMDGEEGELCNGAEALQTLEAMQGILEQAKKS